MATWTLVASAASEGRAGSVAVLILVCAGALAMARLVGTTTSRALVPGAVAVAALFVLVLAPAAVLTSRPLEGPFRYANATAAFFVQAAIASLMTAFAVRGRKTRTAFLVVAVLLGVVPFASRSIAGSLLVIVAFGIALVVQVRPGRWPTPGSAAVLVGVLLATILIAAIVPRMNSSPGLIVQAAGVLGDRRLSLWGDAFRMIEHHPLTGVGEGRFRFVSPTARMDRDASWGHNEFLQLGAETGLPGLALLLTLFVWGFARLWVRPPDELASLAAVALAALGIHACVDYILHFPVVPITTAVLVGTGQAVSRRRTDAGRSPDDG